MRDVIPDIDHWLSQGASIGTATVIQTWGSAPRGVGAKMAFTAEGQISGSVSGGCVEGAVFEAGIEVLESGRPQLLHFGVADETAWEVGLACGGTIDIFVEPLDPAVYQFSHSLLDGDEPFARVTIVDGKADQLGKQLVVQRGGRLFGRIGPDLEGVAAAAARVALAGGQSQRITLELTDAGVDPLELFIEVHPPCPALVIVGGVHIAIALTDMARKIGYHTIIIDPRRSFGNVERFPGVDQLIQAWPNKAFEQVHLTASTAVAILTHDPKIDDPALKIALASSAFYIGALGSRKTHAARRQRLLDAGMTEERFDRIHGPIGLDIGAQTPEEIAVSIMAQIIAAKTKT